MKSIFTLFGLVFFASVFGQTIDKDETKNIKEFYIHTTEPRERDHYRVENYEEPLEKFVSIDTTIDTPEESLNKILTKIK